MIKVERFYIAYPDDIGNYLADNHVARDQIIAIKMNDRYVLLVYEDNK